MLRDDLVQDVLDRPRRRVPDLSEWVATDGTSARLIQGTGRYVDVTHRPAVTVLQRSGYACLEHELARPYLRRLHAAQRPKSGMAAKRIPWATEARGHLDTNPPLYFAGPSRTGLVGEWAYVDLVRAYPSIYEPLTVDLHFRPDDTIPRLGLGRFEWLWQDEVRDLKHMHRTIGGTIRATSLNVIDRGRPVVMHDTWRWSPFFAPDLWGVICWTLHVIAQMAVSDAGARMVNKDGYVVPIEQEQFLVDMLREWGFDARTKARGPGTLWGVTSWQIGRHKTGTTPKGLAMNTIMDVPRPMARLLLRERLRRLG